MTSVMEEIYADDFSFEVFPVFVNASTSEEAK
jgi:hypothetical protein